MHFGNAATAVRNSDGELANLQNLVVDSTRQVTGVYSFVS